MATFNLKLDTRLKVEKDKFHLTVRVSEKKEVLYLRLGVPMTQKEFDSIFIKKSFDPTIDEIKKRYQKYVERAEKIFPIVQPLNSTKFRELFFDKDFNPDNIETKEHKNNGSINYLFNNYIKVKTENKEIEISYSNLIRGTLNNLNKFRPGLTYEDITPEFLHALENWYLSKKHLDGKTNSLASFGGICRNIKAVINYHRKKKIIPATYDYPFYDYKIPNFTPPKRVISNDEIQKIIDCNEFSDVMEEHARDIWVFLYRMNGSNFIDMLKLRWDNMEGDYFIFTRHKTKRTRRNNIRPIKIRISDKIQTLLDKIGDKESPFVLGLINDPNYTSTYLDNRNHKLKGIINTHLKRLGKRLDLCMSLDISLARDSYANTLKRAGTNPLKISENMNHSDPRTTTLHYLDNFDQAVLDDANEALL
jgi:integrase